MNTTVLKYVGILILLVLLCVGISLCSRRREEPFSGVTDYAKAMTDINAELQQGATDGVFTNSDLTIDPNTVNRALQQTDLYLQNTVPTDYSTLFTKDPNGMYTEADNKFCRGVTDPRNLPTPSNAHVRCGWWFVSDPGTPSTGALGNYKGPLFSNTVPGGGIWMWDLKEAAKAEDIKYCKRLTTCTNTDIFNASGSRQCGFCTASGYGVPIDSTTKQALYPSDTVGGCESSQLSTSTATCPPPAPPGAVGGGGGGRTTGGGTTTPICTNDPKVWLTKECIISQARQAGMSNKGGFIQAYNSGIAWPANVERAINGTLRSFWEGKNIGTDPFATLSFCMKVVAAQTSGATAEIRNAALLLASGTLVDTCPSSSTTQGPFEVECMQRLFREKGCQPAGAKYPKTLDDVQQTATATWGELNTQYTGIKLATNSSDPTVQDSAVKDCLGVTMSSRPPLPISLMPAAASNPSISGFANPNDRVFTLRSLNYPEHAMVFPGMGGHVRMDTNPPANLMTLQWNVSPIQKDLIQISAQAAPNAVFRHRGFELHADPRNEGDGLLQKDSSFYVRPGNADSACVSFESVNYPGHFLRHAGFRLFLHRTDGSNLFNLDSTFIVSNADGQKTNPSFFSNVDSSKGWLTIGGWTNTIAIGSDGTMWGTNEFGGVYSKLDGKQWVFMNMSTIKSVDCASEQQVVATAFDGNLFQYRGGWVPLPFKNVAYATIAGDGTVLFLLPAGGNTYDMEFTKDLKTASWGGRALWASLGPTGGDIAYVATDNTIHIMINGGPNTTIPSPSGVKFEKVFVSKSTNKDILGISTDNRLFGLDVKQKWSEIPNPKKVNYAGLNSTRIVGASWNVAGIDKTQNLFTKLIKQKETQEPFTRIPRTLMNGTAATTFANKGIEEVKRICRETPGCVGFNYSTDGKNGAFIRGRESVISTVGAIGGDWCGVLVPITKSSALQTGEEVHLGQDGVYTKMVAKSGIAKYYVGSVNDFDSSKWNMYSDATGHYVLVMPTAAYDYYRKTE